MIYTEEKGFIKQKGIFVNNKLTNYVKRCIIYVYPVDITYKLISPIN